MRLRGLRHRPDGNEVPRFAVIGPGCNDKVLIEMFLETAGF